MLRLQSREIEVHLEQKKNKIFADENWDQNGLPSR